MLLRPLQDRRGQIRCADELSLPLIIVSQPKATLVIITLVNDAAASNG